MLTLPAHILTECPQQSSRLRNTRPEPCPPRHNPGAVLGSRQPNPWPRKPMTESTPEQEKSTSISSIRFPVTPCRFSVHAPFDLEHNRLKPSNLRRFHRDSPT
ncbi:hypothetical protein BJ508DRAFT_362936 [Ascobolus immersus RN42]|uniref:Uncharacterized protein n=1 Tax=Ascobolus immersus RN42 TaxID=1160509 RepID=A0A3N4I199_ASCIM|nr:hypothetical protein BJ508DRAFT_362936 [Ascobolus immersus RN42]